MKNSRLTLIIIAALALASGSSAMAGNGTWSGGSGTQAWSVTTNWTGGTVAGNIGTTTDVGVATFNTAAGGAAVTIDATRNVRSITFDTAADSYTIGSAGANGGNALLLSNAGTILIASTFTGSGITETINAPLVIEGPTATTAASYTFTNNALSSSGDVLNIAGGISGGTSSTVTLNLNGTNTGAINTISGPISNSGASAFSIAVGGNSIWALTGNNSSMTGGSITVAAGSTLLVGNANALGTENVVLGGSGTGTANFGAVGNVTVSNNFAPAGSYIGAYTGSGNLTITGTYINNIISNPGFENFSTGSVNFAGSFYLQSGTNNAAIFQTRGTGGNTIFSGNIYNSTSTGTATIFLSLSSGTTTISGNYNANGKFYDYGGTLVLDTSSTGTRLPNTAFSLGGVTLDLSGGSATSNQTVNGTTIRMGQTTIQGTNSGTALINLGAISGSTGGMVNFGAGAATTSQANSSGILGASYTYGGTDWAVANGASTAISAYTGYTTYTGGATTSTGNYLLTGNGTVGSSMAQNTMKIISSGAGQSLALSSGVTDTVGGILYVGSDNYSITGGTLIAPGTGSSLIIQQWGAGALTIGSVIADNAGSTSLSKGGTGTLILSGANTYTGATYITDGTVSISSDSNLGGVNTTAVVSSSTSSTTVLLSGTAPSNMVAGSSFMGSTISTISGTSVTLTGNANQAISSSTPVGYITALALNGGTLSANSTFSLGETIASQFVNRAIILGANGGTLDVTNGNTLTVGGIIGNAVNQDFFPGVSWTPLGALNKTGLGSLVLSGANTYSGGTTINAGALEFANTVSMPTTGAVTVNSGATLAIGVGGAGQFTNGTSGVGTIGGIFSGIGGQGASTVVLNSGSFVGIDTTGGSTTYAGNITNAGVGLKKLGTNSLTLTGNNTYNGGTSVLAGALLVNNTTGSGTGTGALAVSSGATIGGTGTINSTTNTINGNVQVGSGGSNTTDVLTMTASASTTFAGANLTFNLSATTPSQGNTLALGATPSVLFGSGVTTLTLNLLGTGTTDIANGTNYILFAASSGSDYSDLNIVGSKITNFNLVLTGTNTTGIADSIYYQGSYLFLSGGNIDIQIQTVPEPGTWALMLGGLTLLFVVQCIRRSKNV